MWSSLRLSVGRHNAGWSRRFGRDANRDLRQAHPRDAFSPCRPISIILACLNWPAWHLSQSAASPCAPSPSGLPGSIWCVSIPAFYSPTAECSSLPSPQVSHMRSCSVAVAQVDMPSNTRACLWDHSSSHGHTMLKCSCMV